MKKIAALIAVLIILFTIYWSFYNMMPTKNYENKITESGFSVDKALYHLKNISGESHYVGTKNHKAVQNYIVNEFEKLGLKTQNQTQTAVNKKWFAATTTKNILVKIKGTENGKALLLLTHYDSNPHAALGASDAGSGVVTILEGVRSFLASNKTFKNDIIILISDAEEIGLLGAEAFVNYHSWAKDVGLVLNFEARGSGGPSYVLMETNGKNGKLLSEFINANPAFPAMNSLMYSVYKKLPNDTDLTVFREKGNINGFNFAFIGDHFDYHTAQDSYQRLDRETLLHQADYFIKSVNYFGNSNLNDFTANQDFVYVNFPFIKLFTFPFSWIIPLLILAFILFIAILYVGFTRKIISFKGILQGFIPFLSSLLICVGVTFGLWQLLLVIHPHYQDILHGFTYNGYQYIAGFVFLNLGLLFTIYNPFLKQEKSINLIVVPLFFWLLITILILKDFKGIGFVLIPVFFALIILGISVFTALGNKTKSMLFAVLSIPVIYMFAPLIKMFPVGLGLKNLFISAAFIVLIFGLISPIFNHDKSNNLIKKIVLFTTILFFGIATFNSGFSEDKKLPNSLVFFQNIDTKTAYFATYNNVLDEYTKAILGEEPTKGSIENAFTKSKYNSPLTYHKKTVERGFKTSEITFKKDTIVNDKRTIEMLIKPQRKIKKMEFITKDSLHILSLKINDVFSNDNNAYKVKSGTFLIYHFANLDEDLTISLTVKSDEKLNVIINEISYDLLTNPLFEMPKRTTKMMPMPFVTNDAIIVSKKLEL